MVEIKKSSEEELKMMDEIEALVRKLGPPKLIKVTWESKRGTEFYTREFANNESFDY